MKTLLERSDDKGGEDKMINIIGQIFGTSGYASHIRSLANALNKLTLVKLSTNIQPGFELQLNDKELEMVKRQDDYEINLIITHPAHWKVNCNAKRNWVYLIWEGDSVPSWICEECYNSDIEKIICPSTHTYNALKKGFEEYDPDGWLGVGDEAGRKKVVIIPHGVDLEVFKQRQSKEICEVVIDKGKTTKTKKRFRFFANKGFRNMEDRGGVMYLIKAYLEEFTIKDNVELYLKLNPAYPIADIQKLFPELSNPNAPKIILNTDNLKKEQLNGLYNNCDIFVSTTRAEAFNLPCLEALACGKPVITTNFGGQTDFIDKEVGWLIQSTLVPVEHELEYEGIKWAIPDNEHLKKLLRNAYEEKRNNSPTSYMMPDYCRERAEKYSWDNTAKLINQLI